MTSRATSTWRRAPWVTCNLHRTVFAGDDPSSKVGIRPVRLRASLECQRPHLERDPPSASREKREVCSAPSGAEVRSVRPPPAQGPVAKTVRTNVGLQLGEDRGGVWRLGSRDGGGGEAGGGEDELQLAGFSPPRRQQGVLGQANGWVVGSAGVAGRRPGHGFPQARRGVEHVEVDVTLLTERGEDLQVERVGGGEPVDGKPGRQVEFDGAGADRVEPGGQQLGERGDADPARARARQSRGCQASPAEVAPPSGPTVLARRPRSDHLGTAPGVRREEAGDLGSGGDPIWARRPVDGREVALHHPQPGLRGVGIDRDQDVGDQTGALPCIDGGSQFGHGEEDFAHQSPRRGKLDVGGNAVTGPASGQPGCDLLGQPPFDAPGWDGDQLGSERIVGWVGQVVDHQVDEGIGMRRDMNRHRHGVTPELRTVITGNNLSPG